MRDAVQAAWAQSIEYAKGAERERLAAEIDAAIGKSRNALFRSGLKIARGIVLARGGAQ